MSDGTHISWSDATWNPVVGCDKVSPGCDNCYAIRTAHRMTANPNPKVSDAYAGTEADGEWTGQVNLLPDRLTMPLRWAKPRRIFVNAQSDMFHNDVNGVFIEQVLAVIAASPRHTFQLLTKRHARMRIFMGSASLRERVEGVMRHYGYSDKPIVAWPLPNLWLGVSVEDQQWADIRIPALLDTPAAVRWISAEPLLGPVDLRQSLNQEPFAAYHFKPGGIDWVVCGGESGPGARPMNPDWARSLRNQCVRSGVAYHFKQWGEWVTEGQSPADIVLPGTSWRHFGDNEPSVYRVGKRAAGRMLDGRTWDEYPE